MNFAVSIHFFYAQIDNATGVMIGVFGDAVGCAITDVHHAEQADLLNSQSLLKSQTRPS